jgi:adenylate cyclase
MTSSRRPFWRQTRTFIHLGLALLPLLLLLPHVLGLTRYGLIDRIEGYLYDFRVRQTLLPGQDPRIVIVDIDERSLAAVGQWPWSRTRLAELLDRLFDDYGARVVGIDITFPEPEKSTGLQLLRELSQSFAGDARIAPWVDARRGALDADQRFSEALVARDVVLGYVFKAKLDPGQPETVGAIPEPVAVSGATLTRVPWVEAVGYTGNLALFQQNASAGGFFNTSLVDDDGVVRRMPLLQRYRGNLYESLALATARLSKAGAALQFGFRGERSAAERLDYIELAGVRTRVDEHGAALTPFRGGVGSFPYVSASDVLAQRADAAVLKDRIVLIGTSAPGLLDIRPTPVANQYVGVEAHANMIAGLLDGNVRAVPPRALLLELTTLAALALLMILIVARVGPLKALAVVTGAALLAITSNLVLFRVYGWVLPLATPLIYVAAAAFLLLNYDYFIESRRKRRLQGFFGQYVPPDVVSELDADDAQISLEGESREMSVLFSDVRGFTTLSEGLSPRELTAMMNELLTPLTAVIQSQRGTIDKYMGDAIMAFWGAPLLDAQHARHAVLAALGMVQRLDAVRQDFARRGWPPVHVGVGVSSGLMNVGNMGSQFRMAYTVLGDTVNLGSRLEGLTKQYGVDILISAPTAAAIGDIVCREVDRVRVKGKNEPVAIFEPLGLASELTETQRLRIDRFEEALLAYRARDFTKAQDMLRELAAAQPEKLLDVYLERIAKFQLTPPPLDWDGVYVFMSK